MSTVSNGKLPIVDETDRMGMRYLASNLSTFSWKTKRRAPAYFALMINCKSLVAKTSNQKKELASA
jgi:hypothetical protein